MALQVHALSASIFDYFHTDQQKHAAATQWLCRQCNYCVHSLMMMMMMMKKKKKKKKMMMMMMMIYSVTRHNTASCGVTSPPFLCLYTEPFHNLKM
jgi:hypothetical protein